VRDGVLAAVELVPRAAAAMTRLEALLDRAEAALDQTDTILARADLTVTHAEQISTDATDAVSRVAGTLEVTAITARDAGRAVDGASGLITRLDVLLTTWEKPLRHLAPAAERFAASLSTAEVDAAISLVDRMPVVLDHLEGDVLPMLRQLDRVGPDVHELLEVVEDLRRVVTGLPGVGLLRRRGEDEPPEIDGSVHADSRRRR
jgi:hypothetical protein